MRKDSAFYNTSNESLNRRRKAAIAIAEFQTQVQLGIILGPVSPALAMHQGKSADEIIATSIAAGLETYLFLEYLRSGTSMTNVAHFRKFTAFKGAVAAAPVVGIAGVSAFAANKYIEQMERVAPQDPAQKASFMNSVGAAMAGTFGGINLG